jgi:hypothetical protein
MPFDIKKFESLNGLCLANYVVEARRGKITESDFLPYFKSKAEAMDDVRLELAIGILAVIDGPESAHTIAKYIEHPNFNVRFVAIKSIKRLAAVDAIVMRYVVQSLLLHANDNRDLAYELRDVPDRYADDEARQIASEYHSK